MLTNSYHSITIKESKRLNLYVLSLCFKGMKAEQVSCSLLYLGTLLQIKRISPNPGELSSCSELCICLVSEQIIWFINTLPSKEAYALSCPFPTPSCPHLPTHKPAPSLSPITTRAGTAGITTQGEQSHGRLASPCRDWYNDSSAMQGCLQKVFSPHSRRPPSYKNIWPLPSLLSWSRQRGRVMKLRNPLFFAFFFPPW